MLNLCKAREKDTTKSVEGEDIASKNSDWRPRAYNTGAAPQMRRRSLPPFPVV